MSFNDRLCDGVRRFGPLCVGIDPRWEMLPKGLRDDLSDHTPIERAALAIERFSLRVLELIEPYAGIIKPQSAFFEQFGPRGMEALASILRQAKEMGFVTILDAKRGDIASTAQAYADAALGEVVVDNTPLSIWNADAITVNPYLGEDAVTPFLDVARQHEKGLFVLVRTSNPGGGLFQNLNVGGVPLYRHVGDAVARWNTPTISTNDLGDVGAVVGATNPSEMTELRQALPNVWFLVPGYGAQGGTADDAKRAYRSNGLGAIVNSSRGVTFPFSPDDPEWETKIVDAVQHAQAELRHV